MHTGTSEKHVYLLLADRPLGAVEMEMISVARKLGAVTIGLLTQGAHPRGTDHEQRAAFLSSIAGVHDVVLQPGLDCLSTLRRLRPEYIVIDHLRSPGSQAVQASVARAVVEWGGEVIVVRPDSSPVARPHGATPDVRRGLLRHLLDTKTPVRILEAFNGLSGLVVERTAVNDVNQTKEFDGIWVSSLTDSTARGKPDTELVPREARLDTINQILEVTTKPIIVDGDSGGMPDHFRFFVKTLDRLGVSAVIIEDKVGPKTNSFAHSAQTQENIERFCEKIVGGKRAQLTAEFMVIARIESLIVGSGMEDAIRRAIAYGEAGADAIMIHSKATEATEVLEFIKRYRSSRNHLPIVVVPTTYNRITAMDLHAHGVNIVIYANHLLRSAYPAMVTTARSILEHDCAHDADEKHCLPIPETLKLAPSA